MPPPLIEPPPLHRDGTSQAARLPAALDPAGVRLDDREPVDRIAATRALAAKLLFYDADAERAFAADGTLPHGTWSGFLDGVDADLGQAFINAPEGVDAMAGEPLRRPHRMLFLAFLALMRHAGSALNSLPARHLDHYYRAVLRLEPRGAEPDKLFVLFDLSPGVNAVEVPDGLLLAAGRDSAGRERRYRVERSDPAAGAQGAPPRPLLVSRASISRLAAIRADLRRTGLADVRRHTVGGIDAKFEAMLRLALGTPGPGDPLPKDWTGHPVDFVRLRDWHRLVDFSPQGLFLELFEFAQLLATLKRQENAAPAWTTINDILEEAGRAKRGDAAWVLDRSDPTDFAKNLEQALGLTPANFNTPAWFGGITEVDKFDDLYVQRARAEVREAIEAKLSLTMARFVAMMDAKRAIDRDWAIVNGLLAQAGRRKQGPDFDLPVEDPTDFAANFAKALAPIDFASVGVTDLKAYDAALAALEAYLHMPPATFAALMTVVERNEDQILPADWARVDAALTLAYQRRVYADRRDALRRTNQTAANPKQGLAAIVAMTLAVPADDATADALAPFVSTAEAETLQRIEEHVQAGTAVSLEEWEAVYAILERAWRKREGKELPLPVREEWRNLFAFADVTTARAGTPASGEVPRWKPFGVLPDDRPGTAAPPELIGLAVVSPALALSGGERTIVLTLALPAGTPLDLTRFADAPFRVLLSTAKGWLEAEDATFAAGVAYAGLPDVAQPLPDPPFTTLQIRITLPPDAPALAPPPVEDPLAGSLSPALKLMLRQVPAATEGPSPYALLRAARLARLHLQVEVGDVAAGAKAGLSSLLAENDDSALNARKPILPFGTNPATGSRLLLTHPDLLGKRLTDLRLRLEWMGGPADLDAWYANYADRVGPITADLALVDDGFIVKGEAKAQRLFVGSGSPPAQNAALPSSIGLTVADKRVPEHDAEGAPLNDRDAAEWPRLLRLTLGAPDFGHRTYPAQAAAKSIALAADIAAGGTVTAANYVVNPPYTPKLAPPSLHYRAVHETVLAGVAGLAPSAERLFHVHPFGVAEIGADVAGGSGVGLLPSYDEEGQFLIGLAGVLAPQSVSILFQLADGSGDPDAPREPVAWSYLDGDRWLPIPADSLVADGTRGLINAGIVELRLPAAAAPRLMPGPFYWLRATIARGSPGICDAVAVHANAAAAVLVDAGNAADHYAAPLPANSIMGLVRPLPAIRAVRQPYTSFGARAAEEDAAFRTRISERLRHKGRALTPWDYERLVLERFPRVYKAKCLPATLTDPGGALGLVRMVIIPDIRNQRPFDPFQPKPPADLIADIEAYLSERTPPGVAVAAINPHYVAVQIRVGVRFRESGNDPFWRARLTEELNRYLSPWAYEEGADIVIGRRIYANSLVAFIDERPYVDFVGGIKLFSSEDGETFVLAPREADQSQGYFVGSDRPDAILVAAKEHVIDVIADDLFEEESFTGIGYMKVELDFVVG